MIDDRSKPSSPPSSERVDDSVETLAGDGQATRRRASRRLRVPSDPVPRRSVEPPAPAGAIAVNGSASTVRDGDGESDPLDPLAALMAVAPRPAPAAPARPASIPPPPPASMQVSPGERAASATSAADVTGPMRPATPAFSPDEMGIVRQVRRKIRSVGTDDALTPAQAVALVPPQAPAPALPVLAAAPAALESPHTQAAPALLAFDHADDDFNVPPADPLVTGDSDALRAPAVPTLDVPEEHTELGLDDMEAPADGAGAAAETIDDDVVVEPTEEISLTEELLGLDAKHARPAGDQVRPPPPPQPPQAPAAQAQPAQPPPAQPQARPARSARGEASRDEPKKKRNPWWKDLFNDDYFRTMPRHTPTQIATEGDFIEASLGVEKGAVILDVACGAGRQAIELATRGYEMIALDLSLPMLSRAADDAQERGAKLNFLHSDMREMEFNEMFDAAYCVNTAFGYFDEDKNVDVARRLHRSLKSGGTLLLDVLNRDYAIQNQPTMVWYEGDGCVCMEETSFNFITSRLVVKRTMIFDDGRQREIEYSIRLYSLHELGQLLHNTGFRIVEVSGHFRTPGAFFGPSSKQVIILAQKRAPEGESAAPAPPSAAPKA